MEEIVLTDKQKDLAGAAITLIEKVNAVAAESQAPTGHLEEVDATVFRLDPFTPVMTDADLEKLKADLSLGKMLPGAIEGIVVAAQNIAARFLVG